MDGLETPHTNLQEDDLHKMLHTQSVIPDSEVIKIPRKDSFDEAFSSTKISANNLPNLPLSVRSETLAPAQINMQLNVSTESNFNHFDRMSTVEQFSGDRHRDISWAKHDTYLQLQQKQLSSNPNNSNNLNPNNNSNNDGNNDDNNNKAAFNKQSALSSQILKNRVDNNSDNKAITKNRNAEHSVDSKGQLIIKQLPFQKETHFKCTVYVQLGKEEDEKDEIIIYFNKLGNIKDFEDFIKNEWREKIIKNLKTTIYVADEDGNIDDDYPPLQPSQIISKIGLNKLYLKVFYNDNNEKQEIKRKFTQSTIQQRQMNNKQKIESIPEKNTDLQSQSSLEGDEPKPLNTRPLSEQGGNCCIIL